MHAEFLWVNLVKRAHLTGIGVGGKKISRVTEKPSASHERPQIIKLLYITINIL